MLVTEINSFQLSTIVAKNSILDVCKGFSSAKLILFDKKKPSNSIQELFLTETALYGNCKMIFSIAGSSLLLSFKIQLFATGGSQPETIVTRSSILDVEGDLYPLLITIFGRIIFNSAQTTVI